MVVFKKEQKEEYRKRVKDYATAAGMKAVSDGAAPFKHHMLFEMGEKKKTTEEEEKKQ